MGFNETLFDYLGFALMYHLSVHLTSLKESYPPQEVGITSLTYRDWDNLERVISTYLYGTFTKWTLDALGTLNVMYF